MDKNKMKDKYDAFKKGGFRLLGAEKRAAKVNMILAKAEKLMDEKCFAQAFALYKKEAKKGIAEAQSKVGICCRYGTGTNKDFDEAIKWFTKAAKQGDHLAKYRIADIYAHRTDGKLDKTKAIEWYRKASEWLCAMAAGGDDYGQFVFAVCCEMLDDKEKAREWYTKAAAQGYEKAQKALERFDTEEKALNGDAASQYIVGKNYVYGDFEGVFYDKAKGNDWYLKAAEQGHAEAQFYVGHSFYHRFLYPGVNGDDRQIVIKKAIEWLSKSAQQGHSEAQYFLALCYEEGVGDIPKAIEWYTKSAQQGEERAQKRLDKFMQQK